MMNKYFKSFVLFSALALILIPAYGSILPPNHTLEKTIRKEFDVNSDALLKIQNSYGNLVLHSWEEDRILIEVHITANGNNADNVEKKLDGITVSFEASPSMVYAQTHFEKNNSWSWWKGNDRVQMQVNYTITLPVKNSINLQNDYGNITLDRIDGHAKISCDYGRLDLGELRGRNNELRFDYTSKSRIGYMNSGEIKADYSGFILERGGSLNLSADYTNAEIGLLENLDYSCDYGNLEVKEAKSILGKGDYISVYVGRVKESTTIDANYGSIRIGEMGLTAKNIILNTEYTGIKIGYDALHPFDFEISAEYAGLKGKEDLSMQISKESNHSRYFSGYFLRPSEGCSLKINSAYGSISLEKK
jgi:hypothetical protein